MKRSEKGRIALKVLLLAVAISMVAVPVFSPLGYADEYSDLQNAKNNYNQTQTGIKVTEAQIVEGRRQMEQLQGQIGDYQNKIYRTQAEINELTIRLNETKQRIKEVLDELNRIEEQFEAQNEALSERLRAMYKAGDAGMLSVLFGSVSMTELLTNVEMMKKVYELDDQFLNSISDHYDEVNEKKNELVELRDQLEKQNEELNTKRNSLEGSMYAVEQLKSQVEGDVATKIAQLESFKREADALKAEIVRLQTAMAYAGGVMCWPAASGYYITSPFGYRMHPILGYRDFHTGIDIGAAYGTNILAANSGKVITAAYHWAYGYYVMIDHGGGIVTLYAHSSRLLVRVGDTVQRGQVIALVGSTGMSTGAHLHFEVRVNGDYKQPLNYVTQGRF